MTTTNSDYWITAIFSANTLLIHITKTDNAKHAYILYGPLKCYKRKVKNPADHQFANIRMNS